MVYDIEFIRRVDGKAETLALDIVRLVSESLTNAIIKGNEMFRQIVVASRPDGYRIRETDGPIVYEFLPSPNM
jgi:hypothetical protein